MAKANSKFKTAQDIRVALLTRGMTLLGFAKAHGYRPRTVYAVAHGKSLGPVGMRVRRHLEEVAS